MENLTTLLSVFIGVATVMLLLSMVVTGLAQTVASAFGVRWRSGRVAVMQFLIEDFELSHQKALACADHIYRLPPIDRSRPWWSRAWQHLRRLKNDRAPRELGWPEIEPAIKAHLKADGKDFEVIEITKFDRLRARISDDYSRSMKTVSFLAAFVVAFCFQVSATKLVHDLSISENLRAKALELSQSLTTDPQTADALLPFSTQTEKALGEVREKFPTAASALEQVSGVSDTRQEWVAELRQVLKDHTDQNAILATFQTSLDGQAQARATAATAAAQAARLDLGGLDIRFIEDLCFYHHAPHCTAAAPTQKAGILWANLAGVLVTGILLSFGAPFWYEKLKDLNIFQNQLRGALKKERHELVEGVVNERAPTLGAAGKAERKPASTPRDSLAALSEAEPKPAE